MEHAFYRNPRDRTNVGFAPLLRERGWGEGSRAERVGVEDLSSGRLSRPPSPREKGGHRDPLYRTNVYRKRSPSADTKPVVGFGK
jgi:hypothetical protein